MALRVGGGAVAPPIEEQLAGQEEAPAAEPMPEDLMAELPESLEAAPEEMGGGNVDPMIAVYRGPEQGPFMCGNCIHFAGQEQGSCDIVAGPIDSEGLCNLFTSGAPTQEPMPEGEPYPAEEPAALPEQEPEAEQASEEGY